MPELRIALDPEERKKFNLQLLALDGLHGIEEDHTIGYGAIALTGLGQNISPENERLKSVLTQRQQILRQSMTNAGITLYDPQQAPFSPDRSLSAPPDEIFKFDSAKIARAGHVTFVDIIPSTGCGTELEKARRFGKLTYSFHDPRIRTSRMQPDRTFHLSIDNFIERQSELTEIFNLTNQYHPCLGFSGTTPVMLGVHREKGKLVNLEKEVQERWPHLIYRYDGNTPILALSCLDTSQLVELNQPKLQYVA